MSELVIKQGNIFDESVEAIVNPVNCVGVSGRGLAQVFKTKFPDNQERYVRACRQGRVQVGRVFTCPVNDGPLMWIINFPTKDHWRNPSQQGWIDDGLLDMAFVIKECAIRSVAIPALGCGLGGLPWPDVLRSIKYVSKILVEKYDIKIVVFEPRG